MKLKNMIALLLAVCLCMGLCACGGSDPKETTSASQGKPEDTATDAPNTTEAPAAQAQTATWGDWTIDVPAGCELKGGGFMDENDGRYFSVKKSSFSYFDFSADGEEQIMNHYNYNKSAYTNEQKDVSGTFGGTEWTGFQYSDGFGGYGFEAYATVDGEMIRVSAVGYAFDSELANAVLSSLKHTPSADPEPQPSESEPETEPADTAASTEATEYEPSEGAPVYARSIEFSDMMMGIREGYTELKNGLPSMYVMQNDATGGKVTIQNMAGTAEDKVAAIMSGLDYEKREMDRNGMHWIVASVDGFYCFAADVGSNVLMVNIDYEGTDEEMEDLMFCFYTKSSD
ncbi:MAG: hypothetical protein J5878_03195 [Oscillospiraceae bacterium]|nr:hypothetical protein [Oscillospiraceae bacterium]MBO4418822.1 hypothetical protein [Oscillospiraceae bacterium]